MMTDRMVWGIVCVCIAVIALCEGGSLLDTCEDVRPPTNAEDAVRPPSREDPFGRTTREARGP